MKNTRLTAYLSIPMPSIELVESVRWSGRGRKELYSALDDLCAESGKLRIKLGSEEALLKVSLLKRKARKRIVKRKWLPKKYLRTCEILRIRTEISDSAYSDIEIPSGQQSEIEWFRILANSEFEKRVSDLLVMANISRLGAVELAHSFFVQDGYKHSFSGIPKMTGCSLQEAAQLAAEEKWPPLAPLKLEVVWRWILSRHEVLDGFDGTRIGRALCAFSRLFELSTADEPMQLLWALVGLEALYVEGKAELLQQVREKAQVFLGGQTAFKKNISQMYNFRSRFVHGDLDFPGLLLRQNARNEVSEFDDELRRSISIAIALLASTIQEIIRRDWNGLQFQYTVSNYRPQNLQSKS
jgi:hypothetical protein